MEYKIDKIHGINLVYYPTNNLTSTFGIMTLNGSMYEDQNNIGISHFAEHLFFKGTEKRTFNQISKDIELVGGEINAYTSQEEVFYHLSASQEYYKEIIFNIMDIFFNSTFPQEELEKERDVIFEEQKMYLDNHFSHMYYEMYKEFFNFEYGHPILGEKEDIQKYNRQDIINYLDKTINKNTMCFVYVGSQPIEKIIDEILNNMPFNHRYLKDGTKSIKSFETIFKKHTGSLEIKRKDLQQKYVFDICPLYSTDHDLFEASKLFSIAYGGSGFYNETFIKIREQLGLAYSCGCFIESSETPNSNYFCRYGLINEDKLEEYTNESNKLREKIIKNGLSHDMIECARAKLLYSIAESSIKDHAIAKRAKKIFFGEIDSAFKRSEIIKKVTHEEVNEAAKNILSQDFISVLMIPDKS